jgi:DNA-binding NarL/FixJ family response regulator
MSLRILLVDDSEQVRARVRSALEQNTDWTVCGEAANGETALSMVAILKPQFVILDLSMPGMNGLEAAKRISAISPGTPMIMFTMHDSSMLLKEAQVVGIKHVFSKGEGFGDNVFEAIRAMLPA